MLCMLMLSNAASKNIDWSDQMFLMMFDGFKEEQRIDVAFLVGNSALG